MVFKLVHTPRYGPELPVEQPDDKLLGAQGVELYQAIVGSVLYLAQVTRFDICYAARACSKLAMIHVTTDLTLASVPQRITGLDHHLQEGLGRRIRYTDASFAANPENRKSTTGYLFFSLVEQGRRL